MYDWRVIGPVITGRGHEGPNVFPLGGWHWLLVDEWRGQGVYRSTDQTTWERDGLILDRSGTRRDDAGIGMQADVVVADDAAYVVYFTHPGRTELFGEPPSARATDPTSAPWSRLPSADLRSRRLGCVSSPDTSSATVTTRLSWRCPQPWNKPNKGVRRDPQGSHRRNWRRRAPARPSR